MASARRFGPGPAKPRRLRQTCARRHWRTPWAARCSRPTNAATCLPSGAGSWWRGVISAPTPRPRAPSLRRCARRTPMRRKPAGNLAADPARIEEAILDARVCLKAEEQFYGATFKYKVDPDVPDCREARLSLLLLDGKHLPRPVVNFLFRVLDEHEGKPTHEARDAAIAAAVLMIAVLYDLNPKRRSTKEPSACSIVTEALMLEKMGGRAEASISRIWDAHPHLREIFYRKLYDREGMRRGMDQLRQKWLRRELAQLRQDRLCQERAAKSG